MHHNEKYPTANDIDRVISTEIPCPIQNLKLHQCVNEHMIHGPCGVVNKFLPCIKNGKCSQFFPKKFQSSTTISKDGFTQYRRRDNGVCVVKNHVSLDNRSVVPYNPKLLLKYQGHINVEWCNRSTSIKYLFKYINKGYDKITAAIVNNTNECSVLEQPPDEIKQYLD